MKEQMVIGWSRMKGYEEVWSGKGYSKWRCEMRGLSEHS